MKDLYTKYFQKNEAKEALVIFHGFPCKNPITKNHDIAEIVHKELGIDTYLLHYSGLGDSKGKFSFKQSIEESTTFFENVCANKQYQKINLLGHSWGGLISLDILKSKFKLINKVILFSPYTLLLPPGNQFDQILKETIKNNPNIFKIDDFQKVKNEINFVRDNKNPQTTNIKNTFNLNKIYIMQALEDDEVPPSVNRNFHNLLNNKAHYLEIDTNHDFVKNRNKIIGHVISYLKE